MNNYNFFSKFHFSKRILVFTLPKYTLLTPNPEISGTPHSCNIACRAELFSASFTIESYSYCFSVFFQRPNDGCIGVHLSEEVSNSFRKYSGCWLCAWLYKYMCEQDSVVKFKERKWREVYKYKKSQPFQISGTGFHHYTNGSRRLLYILDGIRFTLPTLSTRKRKVGIYLSLLPPLVMLNGP